MRNYYPLTAAQKMHHNWILDYGTQQVSGVSVVASVQAELDFGLLKKCIQMETERSGCTRVRFTKPDKDGNVKQYIEKQDSRDIELKDLSGMESLAKADELMQQWAYETFDGNNIPMCEFTMLKLPEGYNGFFLHMDHRLIDSCGLVVMIGDLFQLYTYYKYGTAYPQELADFETVLKKDLAKAGNEKRFAKDKKFWDDQQCIGQMKQERKQNGRCNRVARLEKPDRLSEARGFSHGFFTIDKNERGKRLSKNAEKK